MKSMNLLSILALFGTTSLATASAKDLPLSECPAPVQEVIRSQAGAGKSDGIEAVTIDGRTIYVAEVDLPGGGDRRIQVSETGTLLKTREDIRLADAPAAVEEAVKKLVPAGGYVDHIDKTTVEGKVTCEVEIDRLSGRDLKVVFAAEGAIVSQKEELAD